jgi:hypothetical protein
MLVLISTPNAFARVQFAMIVGISQSLPHMYVVNPNFILEIRLAGATPSASGKAANVPKAIWRRVIFESID